VKTVTELITLAKAKPGELNYSSSTNGSFSHIAGELFRDGTAACYLGEST
jgi:tripartite-type tricarboxylate transporter receptor subunit TctC